MGVSLLYSVPGVILVDIIHLARPAHPVRLGANSFRQIAGVRRIPALPYARHQLSIAAGSLQLNATYRRSAARARACKRIMPPWFARSQGLCMPYGRQTFTGPTVRSGYQLNKPTTAIGRSTGNDIVLDTTAGISHHRSLSRSTRFLEDLQSVNGTYVTASASGERSVPSARRRIPIGDIRLVFPPADLTSEFGDTTRRTSCHS